MEKRFWIVVGRVILSIVRAIWRKTEPIFDFIGNIIALAMCAAVAIIFLFISLFIKNEVPKKDKISIPGAIGAIVLIVFCVVVVLPLSLLKDGVLGMVFLGLFWAKEKSVR
ncbi:MAG: hypothetical protein PHQ42_02775 [Patescibacteria group bacterium]|nr:hypothetical protein [Patescibacteria group bacterium]